jgi:hypothetical protein
MKCVRHVKQNGGMNSGWNIEGGNRSGVFNPLKPNGSYTYHKI